MSETIKKAPLNSREMFSKGVVALKLTTEDIIALVVCYSMTFCTIFDSGTPFAISAFAAAFSVGKWLPFAVATVVGILRNHDVYRAIVYISAVFVLALVMGSTSGGRKHKALVSSLVLFAVSSISALVFDGYWYDVFLSFAEALICYCGVRVFEVSTPLISDSQNRRCITDIEIMSVFALMALIVRCTAGIPLVLGMDVSVILAVLFLFAINLNGNITTGAAMGIVFGFATWGKSISVSSSAGAFGLASLCSGLFNRFGKWGIVLGFVFANAVMTAFFPSDALSFDIFEIITAALLFALLPQKLTGFISTLNSKTVHTATKAFVEQDRMQTVISKRLIKLSDSYTGLADAYDMCFQSKEMSKNYIIRMFDTVSSKICPDCGLKYNCWERNYKESYRAMLDMLKMADEQGYVNPDELSGTFADKCTKLKEFVSHFNRMYEVYRVEKMWQQKLNDTRLLVSKQLRAISRCISDTAGEFDMCLDVAAEKEIKVILDKKKIDFEDIIFLKGKGNVFSLEVLVGKYSTTKNEEEVIERAIEEVTGQKTSLVCTTHEKSGVRLTYKNTANYRAAIGFSAIPKNGEEISGDSHTVCTLANGCVSAAISDGMGTGRSAAGESGAAVELYRNFVMSGIDVETSLELINSSLLLRSSDDSFVTMDVCSVDLNSGRVIVSKSGAATGFVKESSDIIRVESDSLPFGVLPHYGKVNTSSFDVKNCALIVMMSDGVYDVLSISDENYISDFLKEAKTDNPQIIASTLLNCALEMSGGKAMDDMTVIVLNVWKI